MLTAQILNSDATLNNFKVISTKQFIPGEQFTLVMRLFNDEVGLRYIPAITATRSIVFNKTDGETLTKNTGDITVLSDDRSIISVTIEESESLTLSSGSFTFSIDVLGDGTQILKGVVFNALARNIEGAC